MIKKLSILVLAGILLSACGPAQSTPAPTGAAPTATLPAPEVLTTSAPDPQAAVSAFLAAWQAGDSAAMYSAITRDSQNTLTAENFAKLYQETAAALTLTELEYSLAPGTTHPTAVSLPARVIYHTSLFGDLERDLRFDLALEQGAWKVQWHDGLVLPELEGGNRLSLETTTQTRGSIFDRYGDPLVQETDAIAFGVDPAALDEDQEETLLGTLARLTGLVPGWILSLYDQAAPGYIPVGEGLASEFSDAYGTIADLVGLYSNPYTGRYYTDGGIAPHVTGYALGIGAEEVEEFRRLGYQPNEKVGRSGLEAWGEESLRGQPAARLTVVDPQGQAVSELGRLAGQAPQNITTTIETDLQRSAQRSLANFSGAIVVLERDTGRVLAMASSPGFDPNFFEANNFNRGYLVNQVFDANTTPLVNRAAQGSGYPLGSVFKIVTMAAALESGLYTAESTLECQHTWTELPGETYYDWTLEKELPPSSELFPGGLLTLPQGLMRSCNPWFYHIGLDLYRRKGAHELANMARAFGLGSATEIGQIDEIAGAMPDPNSEGAAVQLAIGQGEMLVTPLQVARMVAAVGNGGTLYRPQLVEQIAGADGTASYTFQPETQGALPVTPENLAIIQQAMRSVVADRFGTAYQVFGGLNLPIYGKTGTAQSASGVPHAWFAGYTDAKRPNRPDIAVVVLAENAGEGSEIAAPIFRRMIEMYFFGREGRLFRWEGDYYLTRTPTPLYTDTPIPTETPVPLETPMPEEQPAAP